MCVIVKSCQISFEIWQLIFVNIVAARGIKTRKVQRFGPFSSYEIIPTQVLGFDLGL